MTSSDFYCSGAGHQLPFVHEERKIIDKIWAILFAIFALFTSPIMYLFIKIASLCTNHFEGHYRKIVSSNLTLLTLTIYFVIFTTSSIKISHDFRETGKEAIDASGVKKLVESPQLLLVAVASTWVSYLVMNSYQRCVRSFASHSLFGNGLEISDIAFVVDSTSESDFFSRNTVIAIFNAIIGAGSTVVAARCFKIWLPSDAPDAPCKECVPAGGTEMYELLALLVIAFFLEIMSVSILAIPITARHLMEWSNNSTRTGACSAYPGSSRVVRLIAVHKNGTRHLEFQDKLGSLCLDNTQQWEVITATKAIDSADNFRGHLSRA